MRRKTEKIYNRSAFPKRLSPQEMESFSKNPAIQTKGQKERNRDGEITLSTFAVWIPLPLVKVVKEVVMAISSPLCYFLGCCSS